MIPSPQHHTLESKDLKKELLEFITKFLVSIEEATSLKHRYHRHLHELCVNVGVFVVRETLENIAGPELNLLVQPKFASGIANKSDASCLN